MRCEILLADDLSLRGERMLEAMRDTARNVGVEPVISVRGFTNACPLLMTYGTGHEVRRPYLTKQRARGGHWIGWDLGYWNHTTGDMRATLDADHPPALLRPEEPSRFDAQGIALRNDFDSAGPIVLIGMGNKAARLHCRGPLVWETRMFQRIRAAYPTRPVVYRPKGKNQQRIKGAANSGPLPIEDVLKGASLVVCRHSNVAVDACIAGVPVVCEDGAASTLYGKDLNSPVHPTAEQRLAFLRSLAWWNWNPNEAEGAWKYLLNRL